MSTCLCSSMRLHPESWRMSTSCTHQSGSLPEPDSRARPCALEIWMTKPMPRIRIIKMQCKLFVEFYLTEFLRDTDNWTKDAAEKYACVLLREGSCKNGVTPRCPPGRKRPESGRFSISPARQMSHAIDNHMHLQLTKFRRKFAAT